MNTRTRESIQKNIMGLKSIDELEDVHYILKLRWNQLKQLGTLEYRIGDKVKICHSEKRGGFEESGIVEKVNRTSILVLADSGKRWRCSPSVLQKA